MKIQIPNFEKARVLVVGDVMLDRYWYGSTSRISPEAPVPVVHVKDIDERPGGAGNVALNIAALGSHVSLLGVCGDDPAAQTLENKLKIADVNCHLHKLREIPTVTKLRVLSQHQQLIRLDFEEQERPLNTSLLAAFTELLGQADVVILSDYAKGTLSRVQELIKAAKQAKVPVLVDPKSKDFSIYRGATLLTPNLKEFEAVVGPCADENDLVQKGQKLLAACEFSALLITRGEHGMTLIQGEGTELHLPAQEREVYDVTGAGDTVIALLGATLAAGESLPVATALANIAAGISVSKLGAATVSVPELRRAVCGGQNVLGRGVMTEDQLWMAIQEAKAQGERIVMTGGCFDILHAGHVAYLEQARTLGDRLIVVVNDDPSVARLKGAERPINTLSRRMAVLAGLAAVDWVVPFSESTPERIVGRLLPDIWVKSGDYRVEDLPEARPVLANGGEVKILTFVDGCSTSNIVKKIKEKGELV